MTDKTIEQRLDLSPEALVNTAFRVLFQGLCTIRNIGMRDGKAAAMLADAMHNLPRALEMQDEIKIRKYTIEAATELEVLRERFAAEVRDKEQSTDLDTHAHPSPALSTADTARLDFMLTDYRKVVVERFPYSANDSRIEVYVEEGFMGERRYPAVPMPASKWEEDPCAQLSTKRNAIDLALADQSAQG